jgi:hypothetical protein
MGSEVMGEDPIAILERLLMQEPGPQNAQFIKASRDFFDVDCTYDEVQAIEAEFARDLRLVAAQVEQAWGPPDFIGHRNDSDFPDFYTAEELCYWRRDDLLAMIWWEHQDHEVPVLLVLAVLTLDDVTS